jgi:hypothetical protein
MARTRKNFSLDTEIVEQICRVSASKGVPDSDVVEKYLEAGLSREEEHTSAERYHFQRNVINRELDSVLRLFGIIDMEGNLRDKYKSSLYLIQGNYRSKINRTRYGILQASLFDILNDIKDMDEGLFNELLTEMSYSGKIKDRYLSLYPKTSKTTVQPGQGRYTNTNNIITNSNVTTNNSVTQSKPVTKCKKIKSVTESEQKESRFEKIFAVEYTDVDRAERGLSEDEEYLFQKNKEALEAVRRKLDNPR